MNRESLYWIAQSRQPTRGPSPTPPSAHLAAGQTKAVAASRRGQPQSLYAIAAGTPRPTGMGYGRQAPSPAPQREANRGYDRASSSGAESAQTEGGATESKAGEVDLRVGRLDDVRQFEYAPGVVEDLSVVPGDRPARAISRTLGARGAGSDYHIIDPPS